jgi:hypothetical protein
MKNLTSKNKENYHSSILSNGLSNNNNNYNNNINHANNNTNHVNITNTIDKQLINNLSNAKSPVRKIDDAENHNLNIKLEELIKHLHLFEILLEMELVYKYKNII